MRKLLPALAIIAAIYFGQGQIARVSGFVDGTASNDGLVAAAYREHRSGIRVSGDGRVVKVLPDDRDGSRHQRFILDIGSGETLLVAHNIDLAPRIESLARGDDVSFCGVYEWNARGGVVHWTHRDPSVRHDAGWLKHAGRTYQ